MVNRLSNVDTFLVTMEQMKILKNMVIFYNQLWFIINQITSNICELVKKLHHRCLTGFSICPWYTNTLDLITAPTASSVVMHTTWENESKYSYSAGKISQRNNNATYTIHSVVNHKFWGWRCSITYTINDKLNKLSVFYLVN